MKNYTPNGATELNGDSAVDFGGGTPIELVQCGRCEKMITPNLIASFGNDHHDPEEMSCWDCFNGIIARAEAANGD